MRKIPVFSVAYAQVLAWSVGANLLGLGISALFFPDALLLATTGLTSVALIFQMNQLLDENRDAIWIHRRSPWEANSVMAFKVISIFLGVFVSTMACQAIAPNIFLRPISPPSAMFANQPWPVFIHNLRVLMLCMVMAFIYRSAGILLVICWNGIIWSTSLFNFIQSAADAGAKNSWFYALAVLPHLILEAGAYVTAGMSGVFLSKALFKYKLSSQKFFRVSRACVVILVAAVGCLWLAMELEIGLAQNVLNQLKR